MQARSVQRNTGEHIKLNKDIKYKTKALLILEDVDVNSYPI